MTPVGTTGSTGRLGGRIARLLAAAGAEQLLGPARHAGTTYSLTGPEALTLDEAAATMSRVLRRTC
jgi:uncharacterized protein YbjT (DUF2867 family)